MIWFRENNKESNSISSKWDFCSFGMARQVAEKLGYVYSPCGRLLHPRQVSLAAGGRLECKCIVGSWCACFVCCTNGARVREHARLVHSVQRQAKYTCWLKSAFQLATCARVANSDIAHPYATWRGNHTCMAQRKCLMIKLRVWWNGNHQSKTSTWSSWRAGYQPWSLRYWIFICVYFDSVCFMKRKT